MKVKLIGFLVLSHISLCAQVKFDIDLSLYKEIVSNGFFNDEIEADIFVLGESHNHDNLNHKLAILFELNQSKGINKLFLEYPIIIEDWCNEYLRHGQEMDYLLNGGDPELIFGQLDLFPMLNSIREYNLNYALHNPIEIFCFDTPDDPYAAVNFWLKEKFKDLEGIEQLGLYQSMTFFDSHRNGDEIEEEMKFLVKDLNDNYSLYLKVLKADFDIYSKTIQGMKIVLKREYLILRQWYSLREVYITDVLTERIDSSSKCIIFCGNYHAIKVMNDNTAFSKLKFTSFSSVLKSKYNSRVFTIGLHYNSRFLRRTVSRDKFNLLEEPLRKMISKDDDYNFMKGEELRNHPRAVRRYDMIIIKNERKHSSK